jgi:hypothetical protein
MRIDARGRLRGAVARRRFIALRALERGPGHHGAVMKQPDQADVITLIDNASVTLRFHVRTKIVHHEFRAFVHGAQFRDVLEAGLDAFKQHHATKWLSDDRGNGALKKEDAEWALTSWAPRVIAAGWKYWAVVMPEKVIGQMNMRRWLATYAEKGVTAEPFSDPVEAMRWLEGHSAA